jgi:hypothetical protein
MDFAVWNTLHDGSIQSIAGAIPGDVAVRVQIEYLCEKLPTAADYVTVHLRGCRRFEYQPYKGGAIAALPEIAEAGVVVLSANEAGGSIAVTCASGSLHLAYDRAEISLAEGQALSQAELEAAAHRYWTEWEQNARRAKG